MRASAVGLTIIILASVGVAATAHAQPTAPVNIPLTYWQGAEKLAINVGINGGAARPYIFDTGSPVFNAVYNQSWWPNMPPNPNANNAPSSSLPTSAQFCLGGTTSTFCRGYTGNLVQVPLLSFYKTPSDSAPAATLSASPGYVVNAVYNYGASAGPPPVNLPLPFNPNSPPVDGYFFGTFGAGNFAVDVTTNTNPNFDPEFRTPSGYYGGGVLGQTIVPGLTQGYVIAANGQKNPVSATNGPQQVNGINVTIGGRTMQPVTSCSPCVTVGLTPQMLGQFWARPPNNSWNSGVIPWVLTAAGAFPNPYGGTVGNNSSSEWGSNFQITLTAPGSSSPAIVETVLGLLDAGTLDLTLATSASVAARAAVSNTTTGNVNPGVVLTIAGAAPNGQPIVGLATTSAILTQQGNPQTYDGTLTSEAPGAVTNTIGISFFLQNSVMHDLTNKVIGYTPFFVTDAALATTSDGPLIVNSTNVPLGLAGVVSGPGGVTIEAGGAIQLSATNTYTGVTTIAGASGGLPAGLLLVSGPGSIASSAGVMNNGIFDISRAWDPVSIQSLSGSGQVNLGGQNLTITNASGSFSGTIGDGGAFPVGGGSLTLAGGQFTLAGTGSYTGGTVVSGGSFILAGSLSGGLIVLPAGSFTVASGGSYANPGGVVINLGTTTVNGAMTASVLNAGTLGGTGNIAGSVLNVGTVAPGNSIGTLSIAGNYAQTASSVYQLQVNNTGQSDLVTINGAAALLGGMVVASAPAGIYAPRTRYTILSAAGGLSGAYAGLIGITYPFLQPSLSYDANNAYLNLQIGGFQQAAQTPNQAAVGAALDVGALNATGDFATVLGNLATATAAQGQAFMTSISGQNYSGFSNSMVQGAQLFMNNFATQAGGGTGSRVALAEACDVACDTTSPALWGAWGGALGGLGTVGAGLNTGAVTYNLGGFAAGLDRMMTPNLRAGVTVGYTTGTQWVGGFTGQSFSNTVAAGLYGNYSQGKAYLDGLASYAYSANQMSRAIAIPNLPTRTAQGQTGANQVFGQLEGGYRVDLGGPVDAFVTPFARLQGYTGTQNAFSEFGAQSLDLSVSTQTTSSLRSVLGAQLGGSVDVGWRDKLMAQFRLGWSHEYADTTRPVSAVLAGAPTVPFTTYGANLQRDGVVVGVAASTAVAEGTSLYLRYEANISGQDSNHALTAGVRITW